MSAGTRNMESRDENIEVDLEIDNIQYKGNPALLAQK